MKTPAEYLAGLMTTTTAKSAIGTPGLNSTGDWAVFCNRVPDAPVRAISVVDAGSGGNPTAVWDGLKPEVLDLSVVQLRVRGLRGDDLQGRLFRVLLYLGETINSSFVVASDDSTTVTYQALRGGSLVLAPPEGDAKRETVLTNITLVRAIERKTT